MPQQPPRFLVVGLALEDLSQAEACQSVLRRLSQCGFPRQVVKGLCSAPANLL